jgi:hypothetical protein
MLTIQLITLILFAILRTASSFPKRGLAYNNVEMLHNWNGQGSQIQWAYNWGSAMDANFPSCLEYVPMLWDDKPTSTANWVNNVNAALGRGSGHLLSFNEPDECGSGQACMMDTVAAAAAYKQYMMPFEGRASLGAPAITNGDSEMTWLKDFFANCQGCKFDFVPIHWYGDASDVTTFQNYLWNAAQLAATVKAELWVTEVSVARILRQSIVAN